MTENKERRALLVKTDSTSGFSGERFVSISAEFVLLKEDDTPHGQSYWRHQPETHMDGLQVSGQFNSNEPDRVYGWDVHYRDVYTVDLDRAESMVKVLRGVKRKLDATDAKYGHAVDFHAYLMRVASALKIEDYVFEANEQQRQYTGRRWKCVDGRGLQYHLSDIASKFRKENASQ